jgi:putative flippase GtrA
MAFLFTNSSQRGWVQSGLANIVSTVGSFVFHNRWTFSDQQHQGLRLVRGFLSFVIMPQQSSSGLIAPVGHPRFKVSNFDHQILWFNEGGRYGAQDLETPDPNGEDRSRAS